MQQDQDAERDYRRRLGELSSQLDRYRKNHTSDPNWAGGTGETEEAFFRAVDRIVEVIKIPLENGDPDAADVMLAVIGVELAIFDTASSLTVWTHEVAVNLTEDARELLNEPLIDLIREQLDVIAPESGPEAAGNSSAGAGVGPGAAAAASCASYVDRILDRAADRITDSVIAAGGVATSLIGAVNTIGPNLWSALPPGLTRLARHALGAAFEHVRVLVGAANLSIIDGPITQLMGKLGGGAIGKAVVKRPLGGFLLAGQIIAKTDACLAASPNIGQILQAMEDVVKGHRRRTKLVTGGNIGVRIGGFLGLVPVSLGAATVLVFISIYLAHDHLDSPQGGAIFRGFVKGILKSC